MKMNAQNGGHPTEGAAPVDGGARFFGRRTTLQSPSEALHPETPPPPPGKPPSQRRPMLSAFSGFLSFLMIAALLGLGVLAYTSSRMALPGPLDSDRVVFIAPRTEVVEIIDQLAKAKVVDQPTMLKAALVIEGKWSKVRAGEYLFKKQASLNDVIDTLVSGRQVLHSITIPEGLTSQQIVERLRQSEVLAGDIRDIPPEGTLLPETYRVTRGMARSALIRKMQDDHTRLLDRLWARRTGEIPLRTKFELVTLASIIEKETGRADERTRVAAVFYNRLRRGMKLQSDPTIVYGLVGGKGTLGRPIQRDEIRKPTQYNTYVIPALPPGPIANPGRASMEAAINPSRTNDLFFVANGTGGHSFAETLEQHNRNVVRWREIERDMKAKAKEGQGVDPATLDVDRVVEPAAAPETPAPAPVQRRNNRRGDLRPANEFGSLPRQITPGSTSIAKLGQELASRSGQRALALAPDEKPATPAQAAIARTIAAPSTLTGAAAKPVPAGLARPTDPEKPAPQYLVTPGLGELGVEVARAGQPAGSLLDGPATEEDTAPVSGNVETFPVPANRRADMNARAAAYGTGAPPAVAPQEVTLPVVAGLQPATNATGKPPMRPKIIDASEGTKLDPLRNKSWDLNSAQTIPALRTK
jgi:UPF0755 protein